MYLSLLSPLNVHLSLSLIDAMSHSLLHSSGLTQSQRTRDPSGTLSITPRWVHGSDQNMKRAHFERIVQKVKVEPGPAASIATLCRDGAFSGNPPPFLQSYRGAVVSTELLSSPASAANVAELRRILWLVCSAPSSSLILFFSVL